MVSFVLEKACDHGDHDHMHTWIGGTCRCHGVSGKPAVCCAVTRLSWWFCCNSLKNTCIPREIMMWRWNVFLNSINRERSTSRGSPTHGRSAEDLPAPIGFRAGISWATNWAQSMDDRWADIFLVLVCPFLINKKRVLQKLASQYTRRFRLGHRFE